MWPQTYTNYTCRPQNLFLKSAKQASEKLSFAASLEFYFSITLMMAIYRVIKNDCRGFNNLSYTIHLRWKYTYFFLFNRTTHQVFVTYFTGAIYMHPLWFYNHQHDNRIRSTQNTFSLPFAAILVSCAPSGEMHNYFIPHIMKENFLRIVWSIGATTYFYLKCIV